MTHSPPLQQAVESAFKAVFTNLESTRLELSQAQARSMELDFYQRLHVKMVDDARGRKQQHETHQLKASINIQRHYRGHVARKEWAKKNVAALDIQRHYRGHKARKQVRKM